MALKRAHKLGCRTVQIFSHNPRSWKTIEIPDEEKQLFRYFRSDLDISPVYIHASYLINIASQSDELRLKSVSLLREEMRRADALGADFVVLHTGSAHDSKGRKRAIASIIETFENIDFDTGLLIENTSGKKGDIASTIEELSEIINNSGNLVSGICMDTCHAFAAGYDLTRGKGRDELIRKISVLIGIEKLRLIHLNDSKGKLGSGIDRHEHIGAGRIGSKALGTFLRYSDIENIPVILETPKKNETDDKTNLSKVINLV